MEELPRPTSEVPEWIVERLLRLHDQDPMHFLRNRIPALGDRTIPEALADVGGDADVRAFLDRLDEIVGVRIAEAEHTPVGLDEDAIALHPEFVRRWNGWVEHSDGWRVGITDSGHVLYREDRSYAGAPADLADGAAITIRADDVMFLVPTSRAPSPAERMLLIDRITAGLLALGAMPRVVAA
jgi:hypothetical protein